MIRYGIIILLVLLYGCTPKGPQTFESKLVGKTKAELIFSKGTAQKIKVFDSSQAYIYIKREEYFGKFNSPTDSPSPKKIYEIEHIYYINDKDVVYKYQVWKKRIKK